ncbi:MAG: restriction endonuclease [Pseudomonadota bacterium]
MIDLLGDIYETEYRFILYILIIGVLFYIYILVYNYLKPKHYRQIKKADLILQKLHKFDNDGAVLSYLRKVDPYVFEEIVLTSISNLGFKIKRSKGYSGDGGIDGSFYVNGKEVLIQSKRYSSHINLQHVKDFSVVCFNNDLKGVFVHTGRTGKESHTLSRKVGIEILSGNRLVGLIRGMCKFNEAGV